MVYTVQGGQQQQAASGNGAIDIDVPICTDAECSLAWGAVQLGALARSLWVALCRPALRRLQASRR